MSAPAQPGRGGDSWILRLIAAAWLAAIGVGLAIGASGSSRWRAALLDDSPGCIFKRVTGVDCPFCGMTHATVALGAGDLDAAHHAHPLAIVVMIGTFALFGAIAAGRGGALLRGRRPLAVLGVVCAIWALRLVL